jgi:CRISPR-associated protein Cmr2
MVLKKKLHLATGDHDLYEEYVIKPKEDKTEIANAFYDLILKSKQSDYSENAKQRAEELNDYIKNNDELRKKLKPNKYFAMLKFDGDDMGDQYNKLKNKDEHGELSDKICEFAQEARRIIEETAGGLCIYAGGEDVLAALPLDGLWETLSALHIKFNSMVRVGSINDFTFSGGLVIAHLMEPLKNVMNELDDAEKSAKKVSGKNAFSVTLMKRSGQHRQMVYQFYKNKKMKYESIDQLRNLIFYLKKQNISKSFLQNCNLMLDKLNGKQEWSLIEALFKPLLNKQGTKENQKAILIVLRGLHENSKNLQNFMNTLDIMGFIESEVDNSCCTK